MQRFQQVPAPSRLQLCRFRVTSLSLHEIWSFSRGPLHTATKQPDGDGTAAAAAADSRPMAPLLIGPQSCPRPATADDFGLLQARVRASADDILRNPHAAVDHLSMLECIGGAGNSFFFCEGAVAEFAGPLG